MAFELWLMSHKQRDVEDFVTRVIYDISTKATSEKRKYLVMDNSPKNRSARFLDFVGKSDFGVLFITPEAPEHNMAESFFLFLKREYLKVKNLNRINDAEDSQLKAIRVILHALRLVNNTKFAKIKKTYFQDLMITLN